MRTGTSVQYSTVQYSTVQYTPLGTEKGKEQCKKVLVKW